MRKKIKINRRTGAAGPDEKIRAMRWECVRTDRDVEISIRQVEEWKRKSGRGERICVDIQWAVLWLTTTPQANTWAVSYTVTKTRSGLVQHRFTSLCQDLYRSITFQGFVSIPHSGKDVGHIYAASVHTNLTGCPPLFPVTTHSLLFQSLAHTNQSRREAVCHGCTAEELLCINLFRRWLTLDEIKWAVGCLSLSFSPCRWVFLCSYHQLVLSCYKSAVLFRV